MRRRKMAAAVAMAFCLALSGCGEQKKDGAENTVAESSEAGSADDTESTEVAGSTEDDNGDAGKIMDNTGEESTEDMKNNDFKDDYNPKVQNLAADADVQAAEVSFDRWNEEHDEQDEVVLPEDYEEMDRAALRLMRACLESEGEGKNVLISPLSIDLALGMTANAARGTTLSEMENVIGGDRGIDRINRSLRFLTMRMEESSEVKWNVANSIWINKDDPDLVRLKDEYLQAVGRYYAPELYALPFDEAAGEEINAWVNHETLGMIPKLLDGAPQGNLHLINAVAFEGEWGEPYKEEDVLEDQDFHQADGTVSGVNMLCSKESGYFTLEGGLGFVRYYKGYNYGFVGILPAEGETPEELIRKIVDNRDSFCRAVDNIQSGEVYVKIPEFKQEYENELSDELQSVGMNDAFFNADFSGFSEDRELCISAVLHKTFINVNREGTEAAAVTDVMINGAAVMPSEDEPVYITLDRPFVYAIIDGSTDMPLFLGIQNTVN